MCLKISITSTTYVTLVKQLHPTIGEKVGRKLGGIQRCRYRDGVISPPFLTGQNGLPRNPELSVATAGNSFSSVSHLLHVNSPISSTHRNQWPRNFSNQPCRQRCRSLTSVRRMDMAVLPYSSLPRIARTIFRLDSYFSTLSFPQRKTFFGDNQQQSNRLYPPPP